MDINKHIRKLKDLVPGAMTDSEQAYVLSIVELLLHSLSEQSVLIQELKDEINRLKGEQGKPDIRGKNQKEKAEKEVASSDSGESENSDDLSDGMSTSPSGDISSEQERNKGKSKRKRKKKQVKFDSSRRIDKTVEVDIVDKSGLPDDLIFKNYAISHYQDLEIRTHLIVLKRKIYYSPGKKRTYTADFPAGYEAGSDYTQNLKGHLVMLKHEFGMTNPKLGGFLRMNGVDISDPTVSNIQLRLGEQLQAEREAIHRSGLEAGLYTQTDTTGSRVNGENHHSHTFGNEYFTSYFTQPNKDRQTILDLLRCNRPRRYLFNEKTFELYAYLKIPKKVSTTLRQLTGQPLFDQISLQTRLRSLLSQEDYDRQKDKLLEGAYLSAYYCESEVLPLHILLADDAPQYKLISPLLSLCWIHIGRHFKKLNPTIEHHKKLLADFLTRFWEYYHELKDYKEAPDIRAAKKLSHRFDQIFSTKTGYIELDDRIAKTKAKKKQLLVVLRHPYVPLHNNDAELAARKEVRYRDISFQTKNKRGTQAKDVFFTIIQTCKKLGVNAYAYILDRVNHKRMTDLSQLIYQKVQTT